MKTDTISEVAIWDRINQAEQKMTVPQRRLWEVLRFTPTRWTQTPWGDPTGGFWAVGSIGEQVIWFNEIEDGFNRSSFQTYGLIGDYHCNQDTLETTIQGVLNWIADGCDCSPVTGPPKAGPAPGHPEE